MSIITRAVNWEKAVKAAKKGDLDDYLFPEDESERPEDCINLEDFTGNDSYVVFSSIGCTYEAMRSKLKPAKRAKYDDWFWKIFGPVSVNRKKWYSDSPELFKDNAFQASFSPETVANLAQLGRTISFEEMREIFEAECPEMEAEIFAEYSPEPGDSFEVCFLPYLQGWVKFLEELEGEKLGLLVYTG